MPQSDCPFARASAIFGNLSPIRHISPRPFGYINNASAGKELGGLAIAFIRTIILYLLLTVGIRIMGKKQVGELETVELVFTMLISDLAAVPMQDFGIPLATASSPSSPSSP